MIKRAPKVTFILLFLLFIFPFSQHIHAGTENAHVKKLRTEISFRGETMITRIQCSILVNNPDGESSAMVDIPGTEMIQISGLTANVKSLSGDILRTLKKADIRIIADQSDDAFIMDRKWHRFSMPYPVYPHLLEYSFQITEKEFLEISKWYPFTDTELATEEASLTLNLPVSKQIRFRSFEIPAPAIDTVKNNVRYTWKTSYAPVPNNESLLPPFDERVPNLEIVPISFKFGSKGSFQSWKDFGQWEFEINSKRQLLNSNEQNMIAETTRNIPDTLEKIRALYHRLQEQTRYVNISLKQGGMIPTPANEVCRNKFGDCKGLSNYFQSVLSVAGIHSLLVDIYADDDNPQIYKDFPSQQFNHVIVAVPLHKDTIWLDCTLKSAFGFLPDQITDRTALLIENGKSKLVRTPRRNATEVSSLVSHTFYRDENRNWMVKLKNRYRNSDYFLLNQIRSISSHKKKNEFLLSNYPYPSKNEFKYTLDESDRDSACLGLSACFPIDQQLRSAEETTILDLPRMELLNIHRPDITQRKLAVVINKGIYIQETDSVQIPSDMKLQIVPDNFECKEKWGNYCMENSLTGDLFISVRRFQIIPGRYESKEYRNIYLFLRTIKEREKTLSLQFKHI